MGEEISQKGEKMQKASKWILLGKSLPDEKGRMNNEFGLRDEVEQKICVRCKIFSRCRWQTADCFAKYISYSAERQFFPGTG